MQGILIILGPTAIGKTSLAIYLAKKFNAALISADSRQVYKGMDIITGKDKSFPDQGIDLVCPNEPFSVSHWLKHTHQAIQQISRHGKLPLIVGGTGFYIKSFLNPPQTLGIKPNARLRKELAKLSLPQLQQKLEQLDSPRYCRMNHSDQNNSRRLTRAIEIAASKSIKANQAEYQMSNTKYLLIGIRSKLSVIDSNIVSRVHQRIKAGALQETQKLTKKYGQLPVTLGYSQLPDIQKWITAEKQYARRQLTYFKKIKNVHWFDLPENRSSKKFTRQREQIVNLIKTWYDSLK